MVLTNRLARIIDRTRTLEDRLPDFAREERTHFEVELLSLYLRTHLINRAITLSTSSALLVCLVIAALFLGDALNLDLGKLIASLFILAMLTLIGSFIFFLREIFVATSALSMRKHPVLIK
jgi:hypothetical protein